MGDDRPSVYYDETELIGKFVYRASALGNCFRGLVASRLGMEAEAHPDWLLKRFQEGHDREPEILQHVQENEWHGYRIKMLDAGDQGSYAGLAHIVSSHDGQFVGEIAVGERALIRVHLDGIGQVYSAPVGGEVKVGQKVVVEAKAFGPDYWKKWKKEGIEGFAGYVMQLTIEMEAAGLPGLFVVARKDRDGDEGVAGEIVEYDSVMFYHSPGSLAEAKMRVLKVEASAGKGGLPECDMKQYPCQWYWTGGRCSEKAADKDGTPTPETVVLHAGHELIPEFQRQINNLNAASNKIKAGENEKADANLKLTQLLVEAGMGMAKYVDANTRDDGTFGGLVSREKGVGAVRLPDGTSVVDTVYLNPGGTQVRKEYWVRYPKVNKAKGE